MVSSIRTKNYILENVTLINSSGKYHIKVKYDTANNYIEISVEKENSYDDNFYFYYVKLNEGEFKKFRLFKVCEDLEEIFDLISNSIDANLVSIQESTHESNENYLIFSLKMIISGFLVPKTADIKLLRKTFEQNNLIEKLYKQIESLSEKLDALENELSNQRKIMMTVPDIKRVVVVKDEGAERMNPEGFVAPENGWISFRATSNCDGRDNVVLYVNDKKIGSLNNWTNTHVHTPFTWQLEKDDIFKATGGVWHHLLFYPCKQ